MNLMLVKTFAPFIIPVLAGVLLLILGAARVKGRILAVLSVLALLLGLMSLIPLQQGGSFFVGHLFVFDALGIFFLQLLYAITIVIVMLGATTLTTDVPSQEVFYGILLFALAGMGVVVSTNHLATFFLGLEIYTACLYVLIAFYDERPTGTEAAIKYLILGAVSSGFILLGIALLYLGMGSFQLAVIAERVLQASAAEQNLWLLGSACLFVGLCFKLSLVPFHMWAPDVYQGAPTAITAFISTASKGAILAVVIRYLTLFAAGPDFTPALILIVVASIIIGNLLALYQQNLKRLLAYSSVAHLGYAFVPLLIGGSRAWSASVIYLITYIMTALAAFSLIILEEGETPEAGALERYRGLGHHRPLRSAGIALAFFSLAGIPMTAGFIGKWSIFQTALAGQRYLLVGAVVVGAGIGAFYYLRVIANLYFSERTEAPPMATALARPLLPVLATLLLLVVLVFGLYPEPLLQKVSGVVSGSERYGDSCCHRQPVATVKPTQR